MPSGYQNRLSNTYWTSPDLTYGVTDWHSPGSPITQFNMITTGVPGSSGDADEVRWQITLGGNANHLDIYEVSGSPTLFIASLTLPGPNVAGVGTQTIVVRTNGGVHFRFIPDFTTTVVIEEIDMGFNGTF